ncbi:MAG: hypothetical protein H7Y86_09385 [Rhizobacter sp.]|nr:hypothetical protein [Ferruginibacter sp.]
MKLSIIFLLCVVFNSRLSAQGIGIGTGTPDNSAIVDIQSTTKGMLIPRMTSSQRAAISPAPAGLLVFDNSTGSFWFRSAANWVELIDTANNSWKKNGNDTYSEPGSSVGVRTTQPRFPMDVFTDNNFGGNAIRLRNSTSTPGTKSGLVLGGINLGSNPTAGASAITGLSAEAISQHLLFSTSRFLGSPEERMRIDSSGNVGIGLTKPETKLHIAEGTDVQLASGGYIQLGYTNGRNIAIDNNEIQQRNNGGAAKLIMQNAGGGMQLGTGAGTFNFEATGELTRNGITGTADMLPLSYGKVLFDGSKLGGTNNFTVSKTATGNYVITLPNETNLYANQDNYMVLATPFKKQNYAGESFAAEVLTTINSNNTITVYVREFDVNYINIGCNCYNENRTFTYISSLPNYVPTDASFSFIIYKL